MAAAPPAGGAPPGLESELLGASPLANGRQLTDAAAAEVRAAALRSMEEKLSELRNGDPQMQGALTEGLFQAIRDMVLLDVDKKVQEKAEELWQKGKQMLGQIQTKLKEKNQKLTEEVAKCHEKQRVLEAENEKLKQVLQGLAQRFAVLGQVFSGKDAASAVTGTPGNATPNGTESAEFTPPQALGAASDGTESVAKLPDLPPFPFPGQSPQPAAPHLSLAEALGAQTPQRTPLSLVNSLTPTPATEASPSSLPGGVGVFSFTLRKADGADLGLNVSHHETDRVLRVEGVRPDGAVEAWNRQCASAEKAVMQGDRIVSVNNISYDPAKMLEECRVKVLLKLTVVRGDRPLSEIAGVPPMAPKASPGSQLKTTNTTTLRADASVFVPSQKGADRAAEEGLAEGSAEAAAATSEASTADAADAESPPRGESIAGRV